MSASISDYVRVFDTTLRDGEQSPGASLTSPEKLEIARALSRLGVDAIEAGFPAASPDDFAAVRAVAEQVGTEAIVGRPSREPPIIVGLARTTRADILRAWEGVSAAARPRIHTFLATSPIHMEHKLGMTPVEVKERVREIVAFARSLCSDVEFSPEDAGRSEPEFLYEVLDIAIREGATTLNIPDTVGYTLPDEYGALFTGILAHVPGVDRVVLSTHCHDDLGLAASNTIAALRAGARQAEVTINGIGERAGNTSLEEVVMALHTRKAKLNLRTGIDTTQIMRVSRLVSTYTGMVVPPNKAVVGANAFAHESGIHQAGMLKHGATYEIMQPETVGVARSELVLGKHSGRHALSARLAELGYPLDGDELYAAFAQFKALSDKKKYITDADLVALVAAEVNKARERYTLEHLEVSCGTAGTPTATVRLRGPDGETREQAATGTGPVDATYKAIEGIVSSRSELIEYRVHAVTAGIDALGEVSVRIQPEGSPDSTTGVPRPDKPGHPREHAQHDGDRARVYHGYGADTDIIVASAKAYLAAVNQKLWADDHGAVR